MAFTTDSNTAALGNASDVALNGPTNGQVLTYNTVTAKWQNQTAAAAATNATSSAPGLMQLAGDIGGTATSPQVTATHLASPLALTQGGTGSTTKNFVDITTAQTVAGVKTFSSIPVIPVTTPTLSTQAASKSYVDSVVAAGATDASTTAKGIVQLAGDLAGTAVSPQVTATHLASALPLAQGGTGSTTQNFVDLTTAQTVAGVKTFSSIPVLPATTPTTSTQAATKAYVDANSGAAVGSTAALALGTASAGVSTSAARQDHVHPTTGLLLTSQQTSIKAVNVYTGSVYPTRPSGYGSVEWIGPVDPGASALANDTWINTA